MTFKIGDKVKVLRSGAKCWHALDTPSIGEVIELPMMGAGVCNYYIKGVRNSIPITQWVNVEDLEKLPNKSYAEFKWE